MGKMYKTMVVPNVRYVIVVVTLSGETLHMADS